MIQEKEFIDATALSANNFTFNLPKKVRIILNTNRRFRVLAFLLEDEDRVSIGFGGKIIIGTSEFSASYQITIPRFVRELLNIKKGDSIGFYRENGKIYIEKM